MIAEPDVQARLLEVQELDTKLDQLTHRRAHVPEAAEAEELAAEYSRLDAERIAASTTLKDLEREQKRADTDVEQVRARKERDEKRLDSGQINSPKELENLQSEIQSLQRRQGVLEDVELDVMERLEQVQDTLQRLTSEQEDINKKLQEVRKVRDDSWEKVDQEMEEATAHRQELAAKISEDLLALYEKIRADRDGIGAAALHQRRCEGCRMQLDPAELTRIRSFAAEMVLRHEDCRRILVRTSQSGL